MQRLHHSGCTRYRVVCCNDWVLVNLQKKLMIACGCLGLQRQSLLGKCGPTLLGYVLQWFLLTVLWSWSWLVGLGPLGTLMSPWLTG